MLTATAWEHYRLASSDGVEARLSALYNARRDVFVQADAVEVDAPLVALVIADLAGAAPLRAWMGVSAAGLVISGPIDGGFRVASRHVLGGFDPERDEVLGVCSAPRRLSMAHDVFVAVRRWPEDDTPPRPRVYRASLVPSDQGALRSGSSDSTEGDGWTPVDLAPDALPEWMTQARFTADAPAASRLGFSPGAAPSVGMESDAEQVVYSGEWLAEATPLGLIRVRGPLGGLPAQMVVRVHPPGPLDAMCLSASSAGPSQLVTAGPDARLRGWTLDAPGKPTWRQPLQQPASAVVALGGDELLLALPTELQRVRFVGADAVRMAWQTTVGMLAGTPPTVARALGAVHGMPGLAPVVRAEVLIEALFTCAGCSEEEKRQVVEVLIGAGYARAWAAIGRGIAARVRAQDGPCGEHVVRVVRELYRKTGFEFQTALDLVMQGLTPACAPSDALNELVEGAKRGPLEVQSPEGLAELAGEARTELFVLERSTPSRVNPEVVSLSPGGVGLAARGDRWWPLRLDDTGRLCWGDPQLLPVATATPDGRPSAGLSFVTLPIPTSTGSRFLVGDGAGVVWLLGADRPAYHRSLPGRVPVAGCLLGDTSPTAWVLWRESARAYLQRLNVEGDDLKRRTLVPVPIRSARALDVRADTDEVLVGGSRLWWRRGEEATTHSLDAPITAVRLLPDGAVVGTASGLVYRLDRGGDVRWAFRARRCVRDLAVRARGLTVEIAVAAEHDDVVLLDGDGRRRWRGRVGTGVRATTLVRAANGPERIMAVGDSRSVAWRSTEGLQTAAPEGGVERIGARARLAAADAASARRWREAFAVDHREARRFAAEALGAAADEQEATFRDALRGLDHRLLASVARAGRGGERRALALLDQALRRPTREGDDDSRRARAAAVAEGLRWMARANVPPTTVEQQLARFDGSLLADAWVATCAVVTWRQVFERSEGGLGGALDRIPLEALAAGAAAVPARLRPVAAAWVGLAGAGGVSEAGVRELRDAVLGANGAADDITEVAKAVSATLHLLLCPEHEVESALAAAVSAGRRLGARPSWPIGALARMLAWRFPTDPPANTAPLDKRAAWYRDAVARRVEIGELIVPPQSGWRRVSEQLAAAIDKRVREALLQGLTRTVTRLRPRPAVRDVRWRETGEVQITVELTWEGATALTRPTLQAAVRLPEGPPPRGWTVETPTLPPELSPGSALAQLRLRGPALGDELLVLSLHSREQPDGEDVWPLGVRPPSHRTGGTVLGSAAAIRSAIVEQVRWQRLPTADEPGVPAAGVTILVADEVLDPKGLVDALSALPGTHLRAIDRVLAEVGPGRKYPDRFTAGALLRALNAEDPVIPFDHADQWGKLHAGQGELVVCWPAVETIERLLNEEVPRTSEAVQEFLGDPDRRSGCGLVVVLPSMAAARARVRIPGARFLHPARDMLANPKVEAPLVRAVTEQHADRRRLRVERELRRLGGDLRLLSAGRSDLGDRALGWTAADTADLPPLLVVALLLAWSAVIEVRTNAIVAGLVPLQPVTSDRRKPLAVAGEPITAPHSLSAALRQKDIGSIRARGVGRSLSFESAWASALHRDSETWDAAWRQLEELGFLQSLGQGEQRFLVLRPCYRMGLDAAFAGGVAPADALKRLGLDDALWEALDPGAFSHLSPDTQVEIFGEEARAGAADRQVVGRLWSATEPTDAVLSEGLRALAGPSPGRAFRIGSGRTMEAGGLLLQYVPVGSPSPPTRNGSTVLVGPRVAGEAGIDTTAVRRILRAPSISAAFWAEVRARRGTVSSPFQYSGALAEGSELFVGREDIRAAVTKGLTSTNHLLLGARQIGKTSLLNQLIYEARRRRDVEVLRLEGQGVLAGRQLAPQLGLPPSAASETVVAELRTRAQAARSRRQTLIVFLNEIDGLVANDRPFLEALRGLCETAEGLRLVAVGYVTAAEGLDSLSSPLFHFTRGNDGERAWNLSELTREEAEKIVDRLEAPPVGLVWGDAVTRERARGLLVDRSYQVPWVLQRMCHQLVERASARRSGVLTLADAQAVAVHGHPVLSYFEGLELKELVHGTGGQTVAEPAGSAVALLYALIIRRYSLTGAWADDRLPYEDPEQRAFTAADARTDLAAVLKDLPISDEESRRLEAHYQNIDVERLLRGLCLSIFVRPVPNRSYCFRNHILPREFHRRERPGDTIQDRLLNELVKIIAALPREVKGVDRLA